MQWSEVQRQPREVAAAVDESGEVYLERRGQGAFLLVSEERIAQTRDGLDALARLLTTLIVNDEEPIVRALKMALPWVKFLPDKDCVAFAREFTWTVRACGDLGVWAPFGRMLHEWRQTAAIHADPTLAKELSRALDADLGPVMMPTNDEDVDGTREG